MLTKEMSPIDWTRSAREIDCQVRGLIPWPCAACELAGQRFKVYRTAPGEQTGAAPGTVLSAGKQGIQVACGRGESLYLTEIQAERQAHGCGVLSAGPPVGGLSSASFTIREVFMPYYGHIYYGYGDFLANNLYVLLLIPVLLLSLWAQFQVSGSFRRYNAVNNRRRITGAQAAEAVLRAHGVFGVPVRPCRGNLTDHYDPRDNTIYLSETVYDAPTIAAVGVAAHEAGHAVQYAENYGPVRLRTAIIPATRIGSSLSFILLLVGLVLYNQSLFFIGIVLFSFTTLFQLVTLPVEFNASARAIATIDGAGLLDEDELPGAKKVLRAAALTYVAALLMSLLQLMRFVLIFIGRGGRDQEAPAGPYCPGQYRPARLVSCRTTGAWADAALRAQLRRDGLSGPKAALCSRIVYGVMQNRLLLDFYLGAYCSQRSTTCSRRCWKFCGLGLIKFCFWIKFPTAPLSIRRWSRPRTTAGPRQPGW